MPRKTRNAHEEQHTHLAIRVDDYAARVRASVNHNAHAPQYAWNLDDTDPLYEFTNELTVTGIATYLISPADNLAVAELRDAGRELHAFHGFDDKERVQAPALRHAGFALVYANRLTK